MKRRQSRRKSKLDRDPYGVNEDSWDPIKMDEVFLIEDRWWAPEDLIKKIEKSIDKKYNKKYREHHKTNFMKLVDKGVFKVESNGHGNRIYISNIFNLLKEFLTERQYKIFELRYRYKKKYREIAKDMGLDDRTVRTHLYACIKRLRKKLKELEGLV